MIETEGVERRATELRTVFDRSFALPPPREIQEVEDLLAVRVGGDPYAIRLRDIRGVVARRTVVTVPTRATGLLGVTGIHGDIVPVFSLSSFLGYGDDVETPAWTVLCGAEQPIGLAFAELEGHLRLPRCSVHADEDPNTTRKYVMEIAVIEAGARPVIALPLIITDICNRRSPQRS